MKLLYLAKNQIEANLIKEQLSLCKISVLLSGMNLHMGIGELPVDANFVKIFVNERKYKIASEYIEKYKKDISIESNEYWECEKCNESVFITLTSCWNCMKENEEIL